MRYAEVAVHVPVNRTFTYHIPPALGPKIGPGSLVRVEFGVAMQPGVVVARHDSSDIPETKPILGLLDPKPVMLAEHIDLARWLSETCLAPIGACIWLMLPPGFTGKSDRRYRLKNQAAPSDDSLRGQIVNRLRDKGTQSPQQLKAALPKQPVKRELLRMEADGLVEWESALSPPAVRQKTSERVYPRFAAEELAARMQQVSSRQQADLLKVIVQHAEEPLGISAVYEFH